MDRFEERARERVGELGEIDLESFGASFVLFRLATQYLTHLESSVHRPQGISTAGFRVLFTVWVYDELEPRQIAGLSGVSTAAVSGVLTTLATKGLVQKDRLTTDRRLDLVRLTESGLSLLAETYRAQNALEREVFSELGDLSEFTAQLRHLLEKLA